MPGEALAALVERTLAETSLERLRVSSLDPAEVTPALLELMAREPRFCPHFHVSLQAMHPKILRLMKRKYGVEEAEARLREIAALRPAGGGRVFVGMDVITGFPGETEADFEESLARLAALPWARLHVFPFNEREGTPATRLPGTVPRAERARRARRLGELSLARMEAHYRAASPAQLEEVLLEKPVRRPPPGVVAEDGEPLWVSGYTRDYLRVWAPAPSGLVRNRLARVRVEALLSDFAAGEVELDLFAEVAGEITDQPRELAEEIPDGLEAGQHDRLLDLRGHQVDALGGAGASVAFG
jgi:threonylcarbamoyladenosine tRNA methylthiotransferase MtaB